MTGKSSFRLLPTLIGLMLALSIIVWISLVFGHERAEISQINDNTLALAVENRLLQPHKNEEGDNKLDPTAAIVQFGREVILSPLEPQLSSDYPPYESLLTIIKRWNPDDSGNAPTPFIERIQVFDYSDLEQRKMSEIYRNAEVPFKIYNIPEANEVVEKWTDEYLLSRFGSRADAHVEQSVDNHFMYWTRSNKAPKGYEPPTKVIHMTYEEFLQIAHESDGEAYGKVAAHAPMDKDTSHVYFMQGTSAHDHSHWISKDLPFFSTDEDNYFITKVDANKGIQCRFSIRGNIAEAHYDSGRNMIGMFRGAKRYILAPPTECDKVDIIIDRNHPSFRHSQVDWSNEQEAEAAGFANVRALDTIVHQGEMLYIPSYWLHYISSQRYSIQCNSRSGAPPGGEGSEHIDECIHQEVEGSEHQQHKDKELKVNAIKMLKAGIH